MGWGVSDDVGGLDLCRVVTVLCLGAAPCARRDNVFAQSCHIHTGHPQHCCGQRPRSPGEYFSS
jgi:hypothetical protein